MDFEYNRLASFNGFAPLAGFFLATKGLYFNERTGFVECNFCSFRKRADSINRTNELQFVYEMHLYHRLQQRPSSSSSSSSLLSASALSASTAAMTSNIPPCCRPNATNNKARFSLDLLYAIMPMPALIEATDKLSVTSNRRHASSPLPLDTFGFEHFYDVPPPTIQTTSHDTSSVLTLCAYCHIPLFQWSDGSITTRIFEHTGATLLDWHHGLFSPGCQWLNQKYDYNFCMAVKIWQFNLHEWRYDMDTASFNPCASLLNSKLARICGMLLNQTKQMITANGQTIWRAVNQLTPYMLLTSSTSSSSSSSVPTIITGNVIGNAISNVTGNVTNGNDVMAKQNDKVSLRKVPECPICLEQEVNTVLIRCGHTICRDCALLINLCECPICRSPVLQINKLFL